MGRKLLWAGVLLMSLAMLVLIAFNLKLPERVSYRLTTPIQCIEDEVIRPAINGTAENCVNVNTAGVEELCSLPGIGEAIAQKIIAERESNGSFHFPEDLRTVNGIGEKTLAKIRDRICFD